MRSALGLAALIAAVVPAFAQPAAKSPAVRTMLQRTDVASAPNQETILGTVDISPGSGNGFHSHFGSEIGYVLQGHIRLEIKGQYAREMGPGDSFLVPRGAVHRSVWPAAGFEDTELGVFMEPEVDYGTTEVYAGVQA